MRQQSEIVLVDDDEGVRNALSFALRAAGYRVLAYGGAAPFLADEPHLEPGFVVTDVRMPGLSGLDLLNRLRETNRPWQVAVMSGHGDIPMAVEAMRSGACEFIEKPFQPDELVDRLGRLIESRVTPAVGARLPKLTSRETEVLTHVVGGQTTKAIARDLGISPRTVEVHRAAIMQKTGSRSLSDLIRMALQAGL